MGSMPTTKKLSVKQQAFVDAYLRDPTTNADKAALATGVKKSAARATGYRYLKMPAVKEAIDKARKEKEVELNIHRDDILRGLLDIFNFCPISKDRINAADKICKMQGFYASERIEHSGSISCVVEIPYNHRLVSK
jgi:hypothetical protein